MLAITFRSDPAHLLQAPATADELRFGNTLTATPRMSVPFELNSASSGVWTCGAAGPFLFCCHISGRARVYSRVAHPKIAVFAILEPALSGAEGVGTLTFHRPKNKRPKLRPLAPH